MAAAADGGNPVPSPPLDPIELSGIIPFFPRIMSADPDAWNSSTCICSDLQHEDYSPLYAWFNYIVIIIMLPSLSVFGLLTNVLNVFVFTRKRMRGSANSYLLFLACSDFMVILTGLFIFWIDSARSYIPQLVRAPYTTVYTLPFGYMAQSCSIYFTVAAAFDCYIGVCWRLFAKGYCTVERARRIILSIVICSIVYNAFRFPEFNLRRCLHSASQEVIIEICPTSLFFAINTIYNVYMYMVVMTLLPFALLLLLNALIIYKKSLEVHKLRKERSVIRRSMKLKTQTSVGSHGPVSVTSSLFPDQQSQKSDDTLTMIMVVVLFLCCNTLALVVNLIETFFEPDALLLNLLSDASNFLVVFNSSVNCVIYLIFNWDYRDVLRAHFVDCCKKKANNNASSPTQQFIITNNTDEANSSFAEQQQQKFPSTMTTKKKDSQHSPRLCSLNEDLATTSPLVGLRGSFFASNNNKQMDDEGNGENRQNCCGRCQHPSWNHQLSSSSSARGIWLQQQKSTTSAGGEVEASLLKCECQISCHLHQCRRCHPSSSSKTTTTVGVGRQPAVVVYYELQSSSSPIAPDGQCHEREDDLKRKKKKHNVEEASHRSVDEDEGCQSDSGWDERSQLSTKAVSSSLKSGASSPTTMTAPPPPPPFQATTSYLAELKILGPLRTSRFSSSSGRTHHQPTPTHDLLICHDVTENKVRTFLSSDGNQEGAAASGIVPDDERYREKLRL